MKPRKRLMDPEIVAQKWSSVRQSIDRREQLVQLGSR
jgi:hypothetical protein